MGFTTFACYLYIEFVNKFGSNQIFSHFSLYVCYNLSIYYIQMNFVQYFCVSVYNL